VKRFHDAGKSGWWLLVVYALMVAVSLTASHFITERYLPDTPRPTTLAGVWTWASARMHAIALPNTIISVIISLSFCLFINNELKSDPAENAYGEPPLK
jgi:uncharacterized membrane protein YhaH (DUF805 family)